MARTRSSVGTILLRQVYSRLGRNYYAITVPAGIIEVLGWEPGILLHYYPTKDNAMKIISVAELTARDKEFDVAKTPQPKQERGPREGSFAEIQAHTDAKLTAMEESLKNTVFRNRKDAREKKEREEKKSRRSTRRR